MTLAGSAMAQPAVAVHDSTSCAAEQTELEKRIDLARAKGRMLLRQQLADQLATLQHAGIEPARLAAGDFESPASTNFTTRAGNL